MFGCCVFDFLFFKVLVDVKVWYIGYCFDVFDVKLVEFVDVGVRE